jgi:hypothetical protein
MKNEKDKDELTPLRVELSALEALIVKVEATPILEDALADTLTLTEHMRRAQQAQAALPKERLDNKTLRELAYLSLHLSRLAARAKDLLVRSRDEWAKKKPS